jgi:beta-glucanase (GH16 family)
LSWTADSSSGGTVSYLIYRNGTKINTTTTTSYSDSGLTAGDTYSYSIAASNSNGTSNQSSAVDATPPGSTNPSGVSGNWTLEFDDEFTKDSSLNTTVWSPDWFGSGNTQNQTLMLSSSVSVSGGYLNLEATSSSGAIVSTNPDDGQAGHTGYQFTYGFAEAKIYLPASGSGIANWPAWWTNGQDWPTDGEIDIMEGLSGLACYHFHYTGGGPGGCATGDYTGWHTYGAEWQPGSVTYYYDGAPVGQITSGITSMPMYLILENSTGSYGGTVVTPADMLVAYVRVWQ